MTFLDSDSLLAISQIILACAALVTAYRQRKPPDA